MIRPLMEKVDSKSYDAALRTISFPHVSIGTALSCWAGRGLLLKRRILQRRGQLSLLLLLQVAFLFSQRCLVSCARTARLLLFQYPQHLELWRLGTTNFFGEDAHDFSVQRMGTAKSAACLPCHPLWQSQQDCLAMSCGTRLSASRLVSRCRKAW